MTTREKLILTLAALVIAVLLYFFRYEYESNHEYKEAEKRSDYIIDSLRMVYQALELRYDSLEERKIFLKAQEDSLVKVDTVIIERIEKRNEEYEAIYNHLDTADRNQRYIYVSSILETFQFVPER